MYFFILLLAGSSPQSRHLRGIMLTYKEYQDTILIETTRERIKNALLSFGAEEVSSELIENHLVKPQFNNNGSQIVRNAPYSVLNTKWVFRLPPDKLEALKAILLDMGLLLEKGK